MRTRLILHGHFYQPPREDPWLEAIPVEGSAAPARNWNERIVRESYTPLAFARRLDHEGRIADIVNCYEWMSFNFGPTLLSWMEQACPETYARVLEGDRLSRERWGHGNALAQVCHHVILPLASELDKEAEVAWGVADFEARFGRKPEGMWLSETAVDNASLEVLAAHGIKFTILAPRQAARVRPMEHGHSWNEIHEWILDTSRPYLVKLPSGASISVFFYDGPLSSAVAFERLLENGEHFWHRLAGHAPEGIRSLATDGETYGHHFPFGEMALAYVLEQARNGRDGLGLINYGAVLAENPPAWEVQLHEPSAWSSVIGVERWLSDKGDCTGMNPGWNQHWRGPLRDALNMAKGRIDAHYFARGEGLFKDARAALLEYGRVRSGGLTEKDFAAQHLADGLSAEDRRTAWTLLNMQRWALASFASCAWFFDDIGRIEPINAMTMMLSALDVGKRAGLPGLVHEFQQILHKAHSNVAELGTGGDIFAREVLPRRESAVSVAAQAVLTLWAEDRLPEPGGQAAAAWPGVEVDVRRPNGPRWPAEDHEGQFVFECTVFWGMHSGHESCALEVNRHGPDPLAWEMRLRSPEGGEPFYARDLPWGKLQAIALAWAQRVENAQWRQTAEAGEGGVWLYQQWQEAQHTQNSGESWSVLAQGLAWHYLLTGGGPESAREDLLNHLRMALNGSAWGARLAFRLQETLLTRMEADPEGVVGCLERASVLGLKLDLFALQNAYWELKARGHGSASPRLAEALGMTR